MILSRTEILGTNDLKPAEHFRASYVAFVSNDTPLEHILTPNYWANHWKAFTQQGQSNPNEPRLGGIIEVMRHDMTLEVTLRVIGVGPGYVKVRPIYPPYIDNSNLAQAEGEAAGAEPLPPVPVGYKMYHAPKGDRPGHGARNLVTGEIATAGHRTKREAILAVTRLAVEANGGQPVEFQQPKAA